MNHFRFHHRVYQALKNDGLSPVQSVVLMLGAREKDRRALSAAREAHHHERERRKKPDERRTIQ